MFWGVAVKYSKSPEAPISKKIVAYLLFKRMRASSHVHPQAEYIPCRVTSP